MVRRLLFIVIPLRRFLDHVVTFHAEDVADALLFLLDQPPIIENNWGGAKCPKFNIVGAEELNNLPNSHE